MTRRLISGVAVLVATTVLFTGHPNAQVAAPLVESLSGTVADGATIQITGTGFGAKPVAAPLKFDDFERGADDATIDGWDTYPGGETSAKPTFSTTVTRENSRTSARANFVDGKWNSAIGIANTPLPRIYLDGWYYLDAPPPYSRNHKPFRITSQDNLEPHLDYVMFCNGSLLTTTVGTADLKWLEPTPATFSKRWAHIQGYFEQSSPTAQDGVMKFWVDGELLADQPVQTRKPEEAGTRWENVWIGQYLGHDADDACPGIGDSYAYWDDVYVDTSQARVEIGDAPTYAASRHREIQLPRAWSDSSITIEVNQGSFSDLSTLYVYVIDSAGRVSAGLPLIVNADRTTPSVITVLPPGGGTAPVTTGVTAIFDEPMAADRIGLATFELRDPSSSVVNASVTYDAATHTATLSPSTPLLPDRTYTARLRGGSAGLTDEAGNALAGDVSWSFTTYSPDRPPGLVAAYSFDEASGVDVVDSSGRKNAGTMQGGASRAEGLHGGAIQFDGQSGMVSIPDADSLDLTNGMTLEARVNPDSLFRWNTVVMKEKERDFEGTEGGLAYALYANDDTSRPRANINTGGLDLKVSGTFQVPINAWTHIAATYDGTMVQLYVDGVPVARGAFEGTLISSKGVLSIGGNPVWHDEYFHGRIDDVRVYNRALSASEIQADMAIAVPPTEPPPPPPPPPPDETTVFGPLTYTSSGLPVLDKKTFEVTDSTGEYSLRIANDGVMAAVVALNGRVVLRPRDFIAYGGRGNDSDSFDQEWQRIKKGKPDGRGIVPFIEIPVAVRPGANQLFVGFWGPAATSLTAEIVRRMVPPACTVTSPVEGSAVREGDRVVVAVQASDNVRVTAVRFQSSDGSLDVTDRSAPFSAPFTVPGTVSQATFTATAYDAAGNTGACSSTAGVLQYAPPTVVITAPDADTTFVEGATVPIDVVATGTTYIDRVDLSVNGVALASDAAEPYRFLFTVPAGVSWVSLQASAVDRRRKTGTSDVMIVPVVPDPLTTVAGRLVDRWGRAVVGASVAAYVHGLMAEIFDFPATLTEMPSLADRMASRTKVVSAANLRNPGFVFGADPFGFGGGSHAVRLSGYFWAARSGIYTFGLGANEGGRLIIDGSTIVNLPVGSGNFQQGSGRVWLPEGPVPIQILAFDNGNPEIQLSYIQPAWSVQIVPQSSPYSGRVAVFGHLRCERRVCHTRRPGGARRHQGIGDVHTVGGPGDLRHGAVNPSRRGRFDRGGNDPSPLIEVAGKARPLDAPCGATRGSPTSSRRRG